MLCSQEILPHLGPETDSCMGIGEINCDVGWVGQHDLKFCFCPIEEFDFSPKLNFIIIVFPHFFLKV